MAGVSYKSTRSPVNLFPIPKDWHSIRYVLNNESGFEASVFSNGSEIVISYAGTYDSSMADIRADISLGTGSGVPQLDEAVKLYFEILKDFPRSNISFTGHSLGGGLASLMAAYFSKEAVTFDQAPFRNSFCLPTARELVNYLKEQFNETLAKLSSVRKNDFTFRHWRQIF